MSAFWPRTLAILALAAALTFPPGSAAARRSSLHHYGSRHHSTATHPRSHRSGYHHHSIATSGRSHHYSSHHSTVTHTASHHGGSHHYSATAHHTSRYTQGVARDKHGRIKRSEAAKMKFMRQTGYPHGRKGYVIDHVVPLSKGGKDDPSNMQWQKKEEAKAKDKTERRH
jgi:hypothetical protein